MTFSRILMTVSALTLALLGLPCVFAPDVLLLKLAGSTTPGGELLVQCMGALFMGLAGIDWMSRGSLIGGIYGRPVAIGNLMHFLVAGIALFKAASTLPHSPVAWAVAVVYGLLAAGFAYIIFGDPLRNAEAKAT